MGYSPNTRPRTIVTTPDGKEWTYRNARFAAHPDGDLVVTDATSGADVSVWARGMWQHATMPRS